MNLFSTFNNFKRNGVSDDCAKYSLLLYLSRCSVKDKARKLTSEAVQFIPGIE